MNPRLILIILILIALLFVVAVFVGIGNDGKGGSNAKNSAKTFKPPGWITSLGSTGGGPKLELDSNTVADNTCGLDFGSQILTVASSCQLNIKPAEEGPFGGQSLRTLTFRVLQGRPILNYKCSAPKGSKSDDDLCEQEWPGDANPSHGSLVILKGGGTITFSCSGSTPCKLQFEQ